MPIAWPCDWHDPIVTELGHLQHTVQVLSPHLSTLHSQYGGALQLSLNVHARMDAAQAAVAYTAIPQLRTLQGSLPSSVTLSTLSFLLVSSSCTLVSYNLVFLRRRTRRLILFCTPLSMQTVLVQ
jgi:hypothetical protein